MPHWYGDPEWWLLGATVLTAGIIAWQSYFTKVAAMAADTAAKASLMQTTHMVNAERPFLMVEVRTAAAGSYDFYAVNHGKPPAQLIFINPVVSVSVTKFGAELEKDPWYGFGFYEEGVEVINQQWIPPGGDRYIGTLDEEVIKIWSEGHPGLNTGEAELLARGALRYKGRFSEVIWHSRYCYRVFPNCLRMAGPYGWNEYT